MGFLEALGSAGPYTNNLHLAPDSLPQQHQSLSFYRLAPNQQCQNTEGTELIYEYETQLQWKSDWQKSTSVNKIIKIMTLIFS